MKKEIGNKNNRKIICLDEASIHLTDVLNYGRSKANTKCIVHDNPKSKNSCFSFIMAMSNEEMIGATLKTGTFNGESFTNFITDSVLPNIPDDNKILLDNAQIHKCEHFKTIMLINGITEDKFIYNVPYSPKYNPSEYLLNTVKGMIKRNNIKTKENYDLENYYKKSFDHLFDDEKY